MKRKIYYVFDQKLLEASKNITNICNRAYVVHALIESYDLLSKCEVIEGETATYEDLSSFHCAEYLSCLEKVQSLDSECFTNVTDLDSFNLGYDCPIFEKIYDFIQLIAGSSLSAARKLIPETANIDILNSYDTVLNFTQPRSYLKYTYKSITEERKDDVFEFPENLSVDESSCFNLGVRSSTSNRNSASLRKNINVVEDFEKTKTDVQHVAINWFGGWHHAQRDSAEGFCYVNDIVIAIQFLLKTYKRILYIDLDIHHGNGVENAFFFSSRVFVMSFHKYEAGFYPASGSVNDTGQGNGKYYTVNVPLKDGITNETYIKIFKIITQKVLSKYKPQCIVVQCGADSISGDPLGGFNLTPSALGKCLNLILDEKLPTLVLGGGGYNIPNVARCWAYLTSIVTDSPLSNDIPDNAYFQLFGPGFDLDITPTLRRNENSEEYVKSIVRIVMQNLEFLPDIT